MHKYTRIIPLIGLHAHHKAAMADLDRYDPEVHGSWATFAFEYDDYACAMEAAHSLDVWREHLRLKGLPLWVTDPVPNEDLPF